VIKALVCLHNFLLAEERTTYIKAKDDLEVHVDGVREPDAVNSNLQSIGQLSGNHSRMDARNQRLAVANYFLTEEGMVPWQFQSAFVAREELESFILKNKK